MDAWKIVAEELELKNVKEAIFEFLRIEDKTILTAHKYLIDHAADLGDEQVPQPVLKAAEERFAESEPFNQIDQLFLQCSLLSKLAGQTLPSNSKTERKRDGKLKRKLAQKCLLTEFCQMRSNLNHIVRRDNQLAAVRNDLKNLQG